MIEVRIPKEIRDYKPKFLFNLTVRQVVCLVIALAICVPLYVFGVKIINDKLLQWIIFFIAAPFMLMGFFEYNGMTFEQFIVVWFRANFHNQKRPFQEEPILSNIRNIYLMQQRRDILSRLEIRKKRH